MQRQVADNNNEILGRRRQKFSEQFLTNLVENCAAGEYFVQNVAKFNENGRCLDAALTAECTKNFI